MLPIACAVSSTDGFLGDTKYDIVGNLPFGARPDTCLPCLGIQDPALRKELSLAWRGGHQQKETCKQMNNTWQSQVLPGSPPKVVNLQNALGRYCFLELGGQGRFLRETEM